MKLDDVEHQVKAHRLRERWRRLDLALAAIGGEVAGLLIIVLALAILCAPVGLGLAITWAAASWIGAVSHSAALGWAAGVALFVFFCAYVWGVRLQGAARRAVAALMAGK